MSARIRTVGGWTALSIVLGSEFEAFDANLANAVDGFAGGAYAPSSAIVIGGSGISITGVAGFSGAVTAFSGVQVVFTGGVQVVFTGSSVIFGATTPVRFFGTARVSGAATLDSTLDVAGVSNFVGIVTTGALTATGALIAQSTLGVQGVATFLAGVTFAAATTFGGGAPVTHNAEVILAGAGRIRKRIVYGTDSNSTYSILTADVVSARNGIVLAPRTYKIDSVGASDGSEIEVWNWSLFVITLQNIAGGAVGSVPAFSSPLPGKARLSYSDDGAGSRWLQIA